MTLSSLLGAALRDDPGRPLVTWYGAGASERVELSVATAANWVAKTANYLEDDRDVGPGDALGLAPTPHWVSAVVAWATWTLGAAVDLQAPAVDLPLDLAAFSRLVLAQPDAYAGGPAGPDAVAVRAAGAEWSQGTLVAAVRAQAADRCRVLTTLPLNTRGGLEAALLVPLVAARGSVVLVAHGDAEPLARIAEQERVTHVAGAAVNGIAPLPGPPAEEVRPAR